MTDSPAVSTQKLNVSALFAYRCRLVAAGQARQNQLTETITESAREEVIGQLARLARLLHEVDAELTELLQIPLRPSQRGGGCRKAF